jgi:hypothetical protein
MAGIWRFIRKAKELYSWYGFAAGVTALLAPIAYRALIQASLRRKSSPPDYTAIRLQHQYQLGPISRMWCDLNPSAPATNDSKASYNTLVCAIQQKKLRFQPRKPDDRWMVEYEERSPDWNTIVTREELKRFAASIGEDPPFLRDN